MRTGGVRGLERSGGAFGCSLSGLQQGEGLLEGVIVPRVFFISKRDKNCRSGGRGMPQVSILPALGTALLSTSTH